MRGVVLPAALLCAACGLLLAFAPRRVFLPALALLAIAASVASFVPVPDARIEIVFAGCWVSVILIAVAVHLPRDALRWPAIIAAGDAGLWVGLLIGGAGARGDLLRVLPVVLIAIPGMMVVRRGWGVALKVVSSWLIAIALLAALLPATPTPGYVPDHMD